jgi:O-antigen/teichoic acid export membrane protein
LNNFAQPFCFLCVLWGMNYCYHPLFETTTLWTATFLVCCLLILISSLFALFCFPKELIQGIAGFKKYSSVLIAASWKTTANNLILNIIIFSVISTIDLCAVKFFLINKNALNQYSAISAIVTIFPLLEISIFSIITPLVSTSLADKKHNVLQRALNETNLFGFCCTLLPLGSIIFFAPKILSIFGAQYATYDSTMALIILSVGYCMHALSSGAIRLLAFSGNEVWLTRVPIVQLLLILLLTSFLTPRYGIIGAATATTITLWIEAAAYVFIAHWKLPVKPLSFY